MNSIADNLLGRITVVWEKSFNILVARTHELLQKFRVVLLDKSASADFTGHFRCIRKFLVSESDFPSGPWVGFYTYSGAHDKHRMDLGLDFANGRVSGEGNDDVGAFVISGRFDSAKGECDWTKTYIGAHDVFYRGFREGKGIWGIWEILWDARGGFHIWPRSFAAANEEAVSAEEEMPAPAFKV